MPVNASRAFSSTRYLAFTIGLFITLTIYCNINFYFSEFHSERLIRQLRTPSILDSDQCKISLEESDDWFCEQNHDWLRRKHIHQSQNRINRVSNYRPMCFQNNWQPSFHCKFKQRIRTVRGAGKWICDMHNFQRKNRTILIYSIGSYGDFSFEKSMKNEDSNTEIHTFDDNHYECPNNTCQFHRVKLGDGIHRDTKTLQQVMDDIGHHGRQIDIMKVDIEGHEFSFFEPLFEGAKWFPGSKTPYIRQILIEIHLKPNGTDDDCRRTNELFDSFRNNYYAIFHSEPDLEDGTSYYEYALIKLNRAFFI